MKVMTDDGRELEVISRKEAKEKGLKFFFTGKVCKRGPTCERYVNTQVGGNGLAVGGDCCECSKLMVAKGRRMIDQSFEEIMEEWNPDTHKANTKKLPYLSGTKGMGYIVKGFTYVDADWYDVVSKMMWFKSLGYIKCSLSKDNLKRIGKECGMKPKSAYLLLHRAVLGISNEVPMVGDHKNSKTLDNRSSNLRLASPLDNSFNGRKSKGKFSSLYKGVDIRKKQAHKPFRARLDMMGKVITKSFITEIEAARWYDNTLRTYRPSEFNRFNFPKAGERGVDGVLREV